MVVEDSLQIRRSKKKHIQYLLIFQEVQIDICVHTWKIEKNKIN